METCKPYILIADDDPDDRLLFSEEFTSCNPGTTVVHAEGGHELLNLLNEQSAEGLPAVIVLDYKMPDLTGPEVLRQLAANDRYRKIVIVMWSTSQRTSDIEDCLRLGAMTYLVKPGSVEELKSAMHLLTDIFEKAARPS